ncbi:MAG: DNA cytosine methyltransferase [Sulfuricaulis sp.]|nr:DNA cytosine methyltransferase [Sulfuricaulis sp.]
MKPLGIDLYAGLGGWTEGLLAEGYDVIGFDIERHVYGEHRYPAQLVLQDVLTLHGSQFKDAALIVASPPCQEFSYMAMPWTKAKEKQARILADTEERKRLTALFDACFRIQREAIEAAGHHIPMVVENVRGAEKWVGRARWNFGSFFLWGDVPALMPMTKAVLKGGWLSQANGAPMRRDDTGYKSEGLNWSDRTKHGQDFTRRAAEHIKNPDGRKSVGGGKDGWFGDYAAMKEGIKQHGSGREWFAGDGRISRMTSSKSPARKAASAMIARIPLPLARHIARCWNPPFFAPPISPAQHPSRRRIAHDD